MKKRIFHIIIALVLITLSISPLVANAVEVCNHNWVILTQSDTCTSYDSYGCTWTRKYYEKCSLCGASRITEYPGWFYIHLMSSPSIGPHVNGAHTVTKSCQRGCGYTSSQKILCSGPPCNIIASPSPKSDNIVIVVPSKIVVPPIIAAP